MEAQRFSCLDCVRLNPSTSLVLGLECLAAARRYTQVRELAVVVRRIYRYRFCQRSAALASVHFWAGRWGVENANASGECQPTKWQQHVSSRGLSARREMCLVIISFRPGLGHHRS